MDILQARTGNRLVRIAACGLAALAVTTATAAAAGAVVPGGLSQPAVPLPQESPCVAWARSDVRDALQAAGLRPATVSLAVQVAPGLAPPEGFSLQMNAAGVNVRAGDPTGAMYGLLELAEQIQNAPRRSSWPALVHGLHDTTQQPFVEVRADNAFLQCTNRSLQIDLSMWKAYIDMLARNRYDQLDLHGGYDLRTTGFPNLYPLLVPVPEYPQVGDRAMQQRNLSDFQSLVEYARDRGVRVSLMNYTTLVPGLTGDRLADYTAHAVTALLNAVPDLAMLGFRVGESGQKAGFYEDAYVKGVSASHHPDIRLYTRSWGVTREQLAPIGQERHGEFDIEIKYNGEQLGLPYQAIHGGYKDYSYQNYIQPDSPYRIIWQVRANGTHRFWTWEDTEFIRRTVRTLRLGNARGFTLEPPIAYFSPYAADYYRSPADQTVYRYIWQKWWPWYFAWGRLSYDPDLPEAIIIAAYRRHFGAAGPAVYQAVQASGWIVPLAMSYRFPGPDQRDFSPETETGAFNFHQSSEKTYEVLSFARNRPMDNRSFAGIDDWVKEHEQGKLDGRFGPAAMAARFLNAAIDTERRVTAVRPGARFAPAWRLLRTDLLAAAHLGEYYHDRILGSLRLDQALKFNSEPAYREAVQDLKSSENAWERLAGITDPVYLPLQNPLRHQPDFTWGSQLPLLEALDRTAASLWENRPSVPPGAVPADRPQPSTAIEAELVHADLSYKVDADGGLTIRFRPGKAASAIRDVRLWIAPLPSESKWTSVPMTEAGAVDYSAAVAAAPEGLLYMVEITLKGSSPALERALNYPDPFHETPYRVIPPSLRP